MFKKFLSSRLNIFGLFIIWGATTTAIADMVAGLEITVRKQIATNQKNGKPVYVTVPYSVLSPEEKKVVKIEVNRFLPHIAFCNGEKYFQKDLFLAVKELNGTKEVIYLKTDNLTNADRLNGISWKGGIDIWSVDGAIRSLHHTGKVGEWIETRKLNDMGQISSSFDYKLVDNQLKTIEFNSNVKKNLALKGEYNKLTCDFIRDRLNKKQLDQVYHYESEEENALKVILKNWKLPNKTYGKSVDITIHANAQGRFTGWTINRSSGDKEFDDSVVTAAREISYPWIETDEDKLTQIFNLIIKVPEMDNSKKYLGYSPDVSFARIIERYKARDLISNDKIIFSLNINNIGSIINGEILLSSGNLEADHEILRRITKGGIVRFDTDYPRSNQPFYVVMEYSLIDDQMSLKKLDEVKGLTPRNTPPIKDVDDNDLRFSRTPDFGNISNLDLSGTSRNMVITVETDELGKITKTVIKKSSGLSGLDEKAIRAINLAKFEPYIENGEYYPIRTDIAIKF